MIMYFFHSIIQLLPFFSLKIKSCLKGVRTRHVRDTYGVRTAPSPL